ncbi:peptidylprolyl isomerase [[Actinobacillus] muris]|uniref:Peptidylprolyl isomerase n=1 Tax=Muribacter muris TaxID=67855 RepID=A0A0J5P6J3_9PAST|nr:peptidylprolyl isomerase [Muribacter muris]KMK51089.1 peptidylprolyl isomerase [[Actinobacillus] muris] [Muribacter muris]
MKLTHLKSLLVAVCTLLSVAQLKAEERVVATVDGHPLMQSEVQKALGKRANTEANRKAALDDLINDFIVQREIQQSGIKVNYAYVDQVIENIARQNGITYGQLLDYLDSQRITLNQYRQQIAHQMLMEQIRHQSIGKTIQVEPQEVQALAKEMMEKAKANGKIKAVTGTQHRISHILLKTTPILNDKQAKQKLTEIAADINAGKQTFEQAASANSVDYASAAEGGDLGWNFLDIYDPAFAKTAKNSKKGVISAPFKSQFGWHILKVTDTRESDRTEDAYMQKAYEQLVDKQAEAASKDWVKALRDRATIKYF